MACLLLLDSRTKLFSVGVSALSNAIAEALFKAGTVSHLG
jgi:hypothetical protein